MQNRPHIIDIHCHTAGIGAGGSGCFLSPAMRRNIRYRFFLKAFGVTQSELEREGDGLIMERLSRRLGESLHVAEAVVLAMDGVVDRNGCLDRERTEMYIPNDYLAQHCRLYPNLLFGASVNPLRRDALDELDRVAEAGAVLVKWLPSIQNIDPDSSALATFYRRLADLKLPLLTHTGNEESFTRADNHLADPALLRRPLDAGVTVIAAHCASNGTNQGQRNLERLLSLFDRYPNLYADFSSLTQVNRLGHLSQILREQHIHDRLLYGSDMPIIATPATSPWWHAYRLPLATVRRLSAIANPWDRDVELKRALGVTDEVFGNSARILKMKGVTTPNPS